jgi:hypothetical protein
MHMASSRRSRGDEAEDRRVDATGYIELFYSNFAIFLLGHKGRLVISFPINRTLRAGGEVSIQSSLSHPLAIVAFLEVWVCFMLYVRKGEKVRNPSNPPKSGRML